MTSRANPLMRAFATQWDSLYASAVFAGIVAGGSHVQNGYHVSIEDNPAGNYSITRVDDKAPPGVWSREEAAAVDMSMNKPDMTTCTRRLRAVFNNHSDPRRVYFNAFNGWEGVGTATRYDFVSGAISIASADHKTHVHLEWKRRYVNDPRAYAAALSILRGETQMGEPSMAKLVIVDDAPTGAGTVFGSDGSTYRGFNSWAHAMSWASFWGCPTTGLQKIKWADVPLMLGQQVSAPIPGPAGKDGAPGTPGKDGKDGKDGRDGADGQITGTYVISPAA